MIIGPTCRLDTSNLGKRDKTNSSSLIERNNRNMTHRTGIDKGPSFFVRLKRLFQKLRSRPVFPPGIRIGNRVHIGDATRFDWCHGRHISIGDDVTISTGVRILCHDASSKFRIGATWVAPVKIMSGVFIGTEVVILPGVTIGSGAIVAAGAVVTRDVIAGAVVAGIPAKQVGWAKDIDSKRKIMMSSACSFGSAQYDNENITEDQMDELNEAIKVHGGYFLT